MVDEQVPGWMAVDYQAHLLWPPKETVELRTSVVEGARQVLIEWRTDACVHVSIEHENGKCYDLLSPRLKCPHQGTIKVAFKFDANRAVMAVAGTIVANTDDPNVYDQPTLEIPEPDWKPDTDVAKGLLESAQEKRAVRAQSVLDRAAAVLVGKRLRTMEEDLQALSDRGLALRDLLHLVEDGKDYHLPGISAALRSLICTGGQSPLLQRVAGYLNAELLIYARQPNTFEESKVGGHLPEIADFSFAWHEKCTELYQTDLDDWLAHTGFVYRGVEISNNKLLKLLADADGAHSDPTVSPPFDFWHDFLVSGSGYRRTFLLRTGAVVLVLAHRLSVLGKARAEENR